MIVYAIYDYLISNTTLSCICISCSHGLIVVSGLAVATLSIAIVLYMIGYHLLMIFSLMESGFPSFISESFANASALDLASSKAFFLASSSVAVSSSLS